MKEREGKIMKQKILKDEESRRKRFEVWSEKTKEEGVESNVIRNKEETQDEL